MTAVLLLRLSEDLALTKAQDRRLRMEAFGEVYDEVLVGRDGFVGFYDWLRSPEGGIIGIRLSIDTGRTDLAARIPIAPYVVREAASIVRLMFAESVEIDGNASTDQDFGHSRVFENAAGQTILSFDTEALTPDELASIPTK